MPLRTRSKSIKDSPPPPSPPPPPQDSDTSNITDTNSSAPLSQTPSQCALAQTLTGTANLAKLLPTGTLLAFQLLTPVFTHNGSCDATARVITLVLLLLLAASCFLACFTDSFRDHDGQLYYGLATTRGMWLFDYPTDDSTAPPDLSSYRLRARDGVHAVLSVLVFGSVSLRDKNVVSCFYPQPERETQEVLDVVPLGIGVICSLLFMVFPTKRHGIGTP